MRRFLRWWMVAGWMLSMAVGWVGATASVEAAEAPETPAQILEVLLSSRHGLAALWPKDEIRLEQVKREPAAFLELLVKTYSGRDITSLEDGDEAVRFERTMVLLGLMETRDSLAQLAEWYLALEEAEAEEDRSNRDQILVHQSIALVAMGETRHDGLVRHFLQNLPTMTHHTRIGALQYLERAIVADPEVVERLEAYLEDEGSPLFGDPYLQRTLNQISVGE